VKDALVAMTRARAGSVSILGSNNRLLGIFTDGDLRRHISRKADLLDMPVEKVMTRNPITVTGEELAVDVLKVFEEHDIDDLPVVDGRKRLIGSVDIQDLPRLKIL
jgi:arabinose-5-phosphate isomerase